jgi:hypothetical protein
LCIPHNNITLTWLRTKCSHWYISFILGWREFKYVQIRGQVTFKEDIITNMEKPSQEPLDQKSSILHESFLTRYKIIKSSLLKSWPSGVRWDHNRGNSFYTCLYRKIFLKHLYNYCAKKAQINTKAFWNSTNASLLIEIIAFRGRVGP